VLPDSLFLDWLMENGLRSKNGVTRDIICIDFKYGSSSYEEAKRKLPDAAYLDGIADKFDKRSKEELRTLFYTNGVPIRYPTFDANRKPSGYIEIHYRMLYRTPGKAKHGSCMFIRDDLYAAARKFLYMDYKLPKQNAPIVEIGAYSSLVTSAICDRIHIDPNNILILKDVEAFMNTNVVSIEIDEAKHCKAVQRENYRLSNIMFDGQALIDDSIFPDWGNGYILLRHHFTKCAAFCTRIQRFMREHFADNYDTATVTDVFGRTMYVKDILMITTTEAVKWMKFPGITYE